jgi:hypothetical protein
MVLMIVVCIVVLVRMLLVALKVVFYKIRDFGLFFFNDGLGLEKIFELKLNSRNQKLLNISFKNL